MSLVCACRGVRGPSILCLCRYTAVAMPMLYNTRYSSKRRVTVMIAIVWVLSFTISCPLLFGLNHTGELCFHLRELSWPLCRTLRGLSPWCKGDVGTLGACSSPLTEARLGLLGQAGVRVVPGWVRENQWPGAQWNWMRSGDNDLGGCLAIFDFVY